MGTHFLEKALQKQFQKFRLGICHFCPLSTLSALDHVGTGGKKATASVVAKNYYIFFCNCCCCLSNAGLRPRGPPRGQRQRHRHHPRRHHPHTDLRHGERRERERERTERERERLESETNDKDPAETGPSKPFFFFWPMLSHLCNAGNWVKKRGSKFGKSRNGHPSFSSSSSVAK